MLPTSCRGPQTHMLTKAIHVLRVVMAVPPEGACRSGNKVVGEALCKASGDMSRHIVVTVTLFHSQPYQRKTHTSECGFGHRRVSSGLAGTANTVCDRFLVDIASVWPEECTALPAGLQLGARMRGGVQVHYVAPNNSPPHHLAAQAAGWCHRHRPL